MKAKLDRIAISEVEVEIPAACPKCGADFTVDEMNLIEDQWVAAEQPCSLGEDGPCDYGSGDQVEGSMVVGYRCVCMHVLASTEAS
jgi:hypothetical protein